MANNQACVSGEGGEQAPALVASKCTPEEHERLKWTAAWESLPSVGLFDDGAGGVLEMRNCVCHSTLCKPVPPAPPRELPVAELVIDATDALSVGETLRALARDPKTPRGVREIFTRVGRQMSAGARAALVQAKAVQ